MSGSFPSLETFIEVRISRSIGTFRLDRLAIGLLIIGALAVAGRAWLAENPQHDPWAPLDLNDPPGWATGTKIAALRSDPPSCRAVLERSGVAFTALEPTGEGECLRADRTVLDNSALAPARPSSTCAVAAAYEIWMSQGVQPAAMDILGSPVARVNHLGTYSCRRLYGRSTGGWSEHATGNALDVAGFVLEDGRRISLLQDWDGDADEAVFLRRVRDAACASFGTVLSPDYNSAHADHFHLDQADRGFGGVCR